MLYLTVFAGLTLCEVAVALTPALREKLLTAALVPLPWYRPTPGASWVHYQHLLSEYGWVWYLVGVSSIVVLAAGRAGLFVSLAFWVPFVLISVGVATKHHRYTIQLLPFAWLAIGGAAQLAWRRSPIAWRPADGRR